MCMSCPTTARKKNQKEHAKRARKNGLSGAMCVVFDRFSCAKNALHPRDVSVGRPASESTTTLHVGVESSMKFTSFVTLFFYRELNDETERLLGLDA